MTPPLKSIIEAALFAAGKPLTIDHFLELFEPDERPERSAIRAVLKELTADYTEHGIELVQVASGYRFQTKQDFVPWLKHLQPERSPRYSRALLETIAIIAYRQPITRSEMEKIRGISVSTDLMKRLVDYNWIRVLAHRNTPGRPALYGTTREFLNYFNLKNLNELPPLAELKEMVFEPESEGDGENPQNFEISDNDELVSSKLTEISELNQEDSEISEPQLPEITEVSELKQEESDLKEPQPPKITEVSELKQDESEVSEPPNSKITEISALKKEASEIRESQPPELTKISHLEENKSENAVEKSDNDSTQITTVKQNEEAHIEEHLDLEKQTIPEPTEREAPKSANIAQINLFPVSIKFT
jgi:segregation and condensation protein B